MTMVTVKSLLLYGLLSLALAIFLFPIFWCAATSVKPDSEIFSIPPVWIPSNPTGEHYLNMFLMRGFPGMLLNSVIVSIASTLLSILIGSLAAYGFSRYRYRGSNIVLGLTVITRVIPPVGLVVPLYTIMRGLGLVDTLLAVVISHSILAMPLAVWLMKSFFDTLPYEVEEAGYMDGMSVFQVFYRVVLPMSKPAAISTAILIFTYSWGDLLFAFSLTSTIGSRTVPVAIAQMLTGWKIYWGEITATGTFYSLPVIIMTLLFQRYVISGLTKGATK